MEFSEHFDSIQEIANQCRSESQATGMLLQQINERWEIIEQRLFIEVEADDLLLPLTEAELDAKTSVAENFPAPLEPNAESQAETKAFRIAKPILGPATRRFTLPEQEVDADLAIVKDEIRGENWEQQKQRLFDQHDPSMAQATSKQPNDQAIPLLPPCESSRETNDPQKSDLTEALREALSNVQSQDQAPQDELHHMRKQLQDKLRQAEIEISIQRARISQQQQELDEMRHNLERREAKINDRNQGPSVDDKEYRWSRHLNNLRKK